MTKPTTPPPSRRAEYAEATRRAIIAAARQLFAQRGYVATKVDDIAALARVAPATVYAVTRGKQGLLHTLVDEWTEAPEVGEAYREIAALDDAKAIVGTVAALTRRMRGDWGDVMRIVLSTAPLDEATDLLWFFFGYAGFFTLTEDNGWSPRRAEEWLRDTAAFSLLKG